MEVRRLCYDEFAQEWYKACNNWLCKFSLRAKVPLKSYWNGYEDVALEYPQSDFWCFIWQGAHCIYGAIELFPGETIVSGTKSEPIFFTPQEVIQNFDFSDLNPLTNSSAIDGTSYYDALESIKKQIHIQSV